MSDHPSASTSNVINNYNHYHVHGDGYINIQTGHANHHRNISSVTGLPLDQDTWCQKLKEFLRSSAGNLCGATASVGGGWITIHSVHISLNKIFLSTHHLYSGIAHLVGSAVSGFATFMVAGIFECVQAYYDYKKNHKSKSTFIADVKRIAAANLGGAITASVLTIIAGIIISSFWWFFAAATAAIVMGFIVKWVINKRLRAPEEIRQLYIAMDSFKVTKYVMDETLKVLPDGKEDGLERLSREEKKHYIDYCKQMVKDQIEGTHMSDTDLEITNANLETNYLILKHYITQIQNSTREQDMQTKQKIQALIDGRCRSSKCVIL